MVFPGVMTLKYVRSDINEDGCLVHLFEIVDGGGHDADSTGESVAVELFGIEDSRLSEILDFSGLIAGLSAIAMDHPLKRGAAPERSILASCKDFGNLGARIGEFLDDPDLTSLTITIKYTDHGVSLGRARDGLLELRFYPHPRTEADLETRIRNFCSSNMLTPRSDYLADNGRTQILSYALPAAATDARVVTELVRGILVDVNTMREGDELEYHPLRKQDLGSERR
jgi:hypothetical protein